MKNKIKTSKKSMLKKKSASDEVSDGIEEYTIGNWRKVCPCYKVAKSVSEL